MDMATTNYLGLKQAPSGLCAPSRAGFSSWLGSADFRLQLWRQNLLKTGRLHKTRICRISVEGWQPRKLCTHDKDLLFAKGVSSHRWNQQSTVTTRASLTEITAGAVALAVGGALAALQILNKDKTEPIQAKKDCEVCAGSGLCPDCKSEGFILQNLSKEAATKARQNAKDAATRYTAGLAKKWKYCSTCSGGRGCPSCQGRGWVE